MISRFNLAIAKSVSLYPSLWINLQTDFLIYSTLSSFSFVILLPKQRKNSNFRKLNADNNYIVISIVGTSFGTCWKLCKNIVTNI